MKPGNKDKKTCIKFTPEEFQLLQDNSYHMAESYGLDRRIEKLTGKRKISFYSWDLDCLDSVLSVVKEDSNNIKERKIIESIEKKIESGYIEIKQENG